MKKILVIDDESDIVAYISTVLSDEGFEVVTATSGREGLDQARRESPDLITLDVTMPGMSGIEVLTELRRDSNLEQIPVVVITGVAKFHNLTEYRGVRPPEEFLSKPIDLPALISTVAGILG